MTTTARILSSTPSNAMAQRVTALVAGLAASAATLMLAVAPSLSGASTTARVVELPRVVVTGVREQQVVRTVALPRVVVTAARELRTVELPRVRIVAQRNIDGARFAQAGL